MFGSSPKHFAGSPHRVRTLKAASGIGIAGFSARGLLRALSCTGGSRTGSRLREREGLT
jgi:hypothetical protein